MTPRLGWQGQRGLRNYEGGDPIANLRNQALQLPVTHVTFLPTGPRCFMFCGCGQLSGFLWS